MTEEVGVARENSNHTLVVALMLGGAGAILIIMGLVLQLLKGIFIEIGSVISLVGFISIFVTIVGIFAFYAPQYIKEGTIRK